MGVFIRDVHEKCNKKGCSRCDKTSRPQSPETSVVDLLVACYCHCQWKGLPWLHGASTLVCLYMLHIPDFYNSLLHSVTPNTPNNFPSFTRGANVRDSFMIIDLWSTVSMLGHTGYQNTGFLLQWQIGACNIIYWALAQDDVYEKQLQAVIRYWWKQPRVIYASISI